MSNTATIEGKRITLKRNRPNPLFEEWLEELYEQARAKKSKLEFILREALESLLKYPLPLQSGAECAVLKGFDKNLCKFLDKRLEVININQQNQVSSTSRDSLDTRRLNNTSPKSDKKATNSSKEKYAANIDENVNPLNSDKQSTSLKTKVSKSRCKKYKPVFRSGGYAIMIALYEYGVENSNNGGLSKEELVNLAQQHSEESFSRPKPETFYSAWSSMKTLISKGLVAQVRSKKTKYFLTEEGKALAIELKEDARNTPTVNDIIFNEGSHSQSSIGTSTSSQLALTSPSNSQQSCLSIDKIQRVNSVAKTIEMPPGSFDIILLVDKNETGGVNNKKDPTVAQFNKYPSLNHEYRSLKVGDFTWIARHKTYKDQELVLPHIVERKRMDDLGASIKDGRFHEQKFRLRKCGLANVYYLVEHFGTNKHVGLPIQSLMQALANTRVQDGFKVHITDSLTNSARFLAMMTKRLTLEYKDKHLIGGNCEPKGEELMEFEYFNKSSVKNKPLTVKEMFIKMLLQLRGVSVDKALAITNVYSTPKALIKEYEKCTQKEGEMLLSGLKFSELNHKVGPAVSKSIYKFFVWKG